MFSSLCAIGIIFLLAGFIQGVTGFGSALVAMPLLCLFIDVKEAIPLCMLSSLIITTVLAVKLKSHIDRKKILPLCLSSLPGILLGTTILTQIDARIISFLLGLLLTTYSIYSLACSPRPRSLRPAWGYVAGFSSGAIGAAFSAGGPPTIIYAALNNWGKDDIKATLTGFFVFNAIITASVHAITGLTTPAVLESFAVSAPCALVGTLSGSICYGLLPRTTYMKSIFTFLIIMGLSMMLTS